MSAHTISDLNEHLAASLGRIYNGDGIFRWEYSEDLMWPAFATGRMIAKPVEVPIIGGGSEMTEMMVPEYRREKQNTQLDRQWVITKWHAPESLAQWQANFPGADYPASGYRIFTNASLPSYPGGPHEPNWTDTERFIQLIRFQRNHTINEVATGIDNERIARDAATQKEIEDEIRDDMPAFMNIEPGKRGGYVSFPYSKKDLQ